MLAPEPRAQQLPSPHSTSSTCSSSTSRQHLGCVLSLLPSPGPSTFSVEFLPLATWPPTPVYIHPSFS